MSAFLWWHAAGCFVVLGWTMLGPFFWAMARERRQRRPATAPDDERDERGLCAYVHDGPCRWPGEGTA